MRFLIGLITGLPSKPTEKDQHKVKSTAAWIHDRISRLPVETPDSQGRHRPLHSLAPQHSRRAVSFGGGAGQSSRRPSSASPRAVTVDEDDGETKDIVYQAVRSTALIYARAGMHRRPLRDSVVCSSEDVLKVWTTVWRVPLRAWKGILGVFVWVVLSILPAASSLAQEGTMAMMTAHARFVKSLVTGGFLQMSLDDWGVAEVAMKGAVALVGWLGERQREDKEDMDGESGMEDETGVNVVDPALLLSVETANMTAASEW